MLLFLFIDLYVDSARSISYKMFADSLVEMILMDTEPNAISAKAELIGAKAIDAIIEVLGDFDFVEDEVHIFLEHEVDIPDSVPFLSDDSEKEQSSFSSTTTTCTTTTDAGEEYVPENKKARYAHTHITLEEKIRGVNLARLHPRWSISTLQKHGVPSLRHKGLLTKWKKDIEKGGTQADKYEIINNTTYARFVEARERNEPVTTRSLQQWALAASMQFTDLQFTASLRWVTKFKSKYKIPQRKVTKYVAAKDRASLEETIKSAEIFQKQTARLLQNFDAKFVINTDQTGCEYRMDIKRTLSYKGEKTVQLAVRDKNKITHSYTAQYSITASGELLPAVFLCTQEPSGIFGPWILTNVKALEREYGNVIVTCSKSGKLTTALFEQFLDTVIKPYVENNKFLLILDSWGGQTNGALYDERFRDEDDEPTCTVKIIPPKCTPLCQPCDVYFYRQVKIFISQLQNATCLLEQNREISSREDEIKIHSLIHHQLSSPIFHDMLQYAWYASKLIQERRVFFNVKEICFPPDMRREKCYCKNISFIKCARCKYALCFTCFFDKYHPKYCKGEDTAN